jgi:glycosyltransferase involved in cell wall biosynthesis
MPELSVVVPTLKPRSEVECVRYLDRQSFADYEVLLQDEPRATVARNRGIERAAADKLVFLDDDSRPREGYLARAADLLDREAVVAGRSVHPRDDVFARRFTGHYDRGDTSRYVTRFWGHNVVARKEVFETVGPWDERITWGHEEKELAERVLEEYPIYYDPDLVVDHVYADSAVDYLVKQYRLDTQLPYLWEKQGVPGWRQWTYVVRDAFDPTNYLGFSPEHAALRAGKTLARTAGRIRGMLRTP